MQQRRSTPNSSMRNYTAVKQFLTHSSIKNPSFFEKIFQNNK
jgi:hypothetical protein